MDRIEDVISQIQGHQASANASYAAHLDASKVVREKIEALQQMIRDGHTTGDRFRDFAIVCHGSLDEKIAERYQQLQQEIAGKQGQLALLFQVQHMPAQDTGCVRSFEHDEWMFWLTELTGEELVLDYESGCLFPSMKHVHHHDRNGSRIPDVLTSPLSIAGWRKGMLLENETIVSKAEGALLWALGYRSLISTSSGGAVNRVIGSEQVSTWFSKIRNGGFQPIYAKMVAGLQGPPVPGP